ncbi:MAG: adenosylcobinamide-GDP ribazoletransferase [Methanosarcinales archaeon]|nr:adenosylcobinamide-GDP ribazoletransferase [Methanosarcinales archaeon]
MLDGFLGAIGFLTTLPAGRADRLVHLQSRTSLFSVVGILVGLLLGIIATSLIIVIPDQPAIVAVLMIMSIYTFTGLNHLDGLSDFGDGITAHGSREKKIIALKDMALGTGGAAFIVLYILMLFVIIQALANILIDLNWGYSLGFFFLVAEVSSKHSMITASWLGRPIHQGMGSMIADNTGLKQFLISLIISALVCTAILGSSGIAAVVGAMIGSVLVIFISNRHFGGINGDCIGTSNEIGRLMALIVLFIICRGGIAVWMPW